MRRIMAKVVLVAGILAGVIGVSTPASAALLCPPGCFVAGTTLGAGGFPDPTSFSYDGTFAVTAITNHNDATFDFTRQYYIRILGDVTLSGENVTGRANYAVSTDPFPVAGSLAMRNPNHWFTGTVAISGKRYAIYMPGTYMSMTLESTPLTTCSTCTARYVGSFFYNH